MINHSKRIVCIFVNIYIYTLSFAVHEIGHNMRINQVPKSELTQMNHLGSNTSFFASCWHSGNSPWKCRALNRIFVSTTNSSLHDHAIAEQRWWINPNSPSKYGWGKNLKNKKPPSRRLTTSLRCHTQVLQQKAIFRILLAIEGNANQNLRKVWTTFFLLPGSGGFLCWNVWMSNSRWWIR